MILTIIFLIKIIIVVSILSFIGLIVFFGIKSLPFRQKLTISETLDFLKVLRVTDKKYSQIMEKRKIIEEKWSKLLEKIKSNDERDLRLAVIEADSLVDEILKSHNHPGKDMGERLKSLHSGELEFIDDLWEAHKIRNRLAHEADFHLPAEEAQRLIEIYHKILEELLSKELEISN